MEEILGYVFSWILGETVPQARKAWGNQGCLLAAIIAAVLLAWILPANYLRNRGEDWTTILILGPLATIVLFFMITTTYGIGRRPKVEGDERRGPSATEELPAQEDEALASAIAEANRHLSIKEDDLRFRCPECGHVNRASAVDCATCGKPRPTLVAHEG